MRRSLFIGIACALLCSHVQAAEPRINIDNTLYKCVDIAPDGLTFFGHTVLLKTRWEWRKSTGECGCKSALISYTASSANGVAMAAGILSVMRQQREFNFVVNPDSSVAHPLPFKLLITCTGESGVSL